MDSSGLDVIKESITRMNKLINGEKIKCPDCIDGYIVAVGNPKTTSLFQCKCGCRIFVDNKRLSTM